MKKFHGVMAGLGVAFLIYLVWKVGARELWLEIKVLGWGVAPLILTEGIGNLAHTAGWRHCLSAPQRRSGFIPLFHMAMAGFAINYLTPTASVGGEVTKAALLASDRRRAPAVTSVVLDKTCVAFAHLLLVAVGGAIVILQVELPLIVRTAMIVSTVTMSGGILGFMFLQQRGQLGCILRWLVAHGIGRHALKNAADRISAVDDRLRNFYREQPLQLVWSVSWHFLGHSMALVQTWIFFRLLNHEVVLANVLCAGILCLWFDLLTFAVPLNLGTMEGSRLLALKQVGYTTLQGMTYGVALRTAQLFWAGFGLASYGLFIWRAGKSKASAPLAGNPEESSPRDQFQKSAVAR
jgi:hypothetical protein